MSLLYETYKAKQVYVFHGAELNSDESGITDEVRSAQQEFHKSFLPVFKSRDERLVKECLHEGI